MAIIGSRQVGKTVLAQQLRPLAYYIEQEQLPFGIVINQSNRATWLTDRIDQLPVTYL